MSSPAASRVADGWQMTRFRVCDPAVVVRYPEPAILVMPPLDEARRVQRRMAAFTAGDSGDRGAFDAHMARLRSSPDITLRAVTCDGRLVGSIASLVVEKQTEITYWIDRAAWGDWIDRAAWGGGIATRAVTLLLDLVPARPLHARAASDNADSLRVLQKTGFKVIGTETSFAAEGTSKSRKPSFAWTNT
jgi:RimJ/RimL family protein N-acetyltransferase